MDQHCSAKRTQVMTDPDGPARDDGVLESLVVGLGHDAEPAEGGSTFSPDHKAEGPGSLPGRRPGTHLASAPSPTAGPAAVILDCGTSRHPNFTHVLLISPAAPHVLGEHGASRLGEVINTIAGVSAFEWEGGDHLHLLAPNFGHADLLREARVIVAHMLA